MYNKNVLVFLVIKAAKEDSELSEFFTNEDKP